MGFISIQCMPKAIIIGAGASGLAGAWKLKRDGWDVTVLEKGPRFGGAVHTTLENGFMAEDGPNSFMITDSRVLQFISDLGLDGDLLDANPAANKRYIIKDGKPMPMPMSPVQFVTTPLISWPGKLRVGLEPFMPRTKGEDTDFREFVTRRLGKELYERFINPFVAGVYAGDPARLSARHAFPKLWALEEHSGSFILGAFALVTGIRKREATRIKPRLVSFRNGLGQLVDALLEGIGEQSALCGATIEKIDCEEGADAKWSVTYTHGGRSQTVTADAIVCSVPAHSVPELPWPEAFRARHEGLKSIPYPPVTCVVTGYRREDVAHPLDGFGFLVPEVENRRVLGTLFSSTLFPGRAPEGHVLLTTFVGGSRQPELCELDEQELLEVVCGEHRDMLGVSGSPVYKKFTQWPRAIPQYSLGHPPVITALSSGSDKAPNLSYLANYKGGIALGQCLLNGLTLEF